MKLVLGLLLAISSQTFAADDLDSKLTAALSCHSSGIVCKNADRVMNECR